MDYGLHSSERLRNHQVMKSIIVLGSGYRCGSTFMQRILNTIPGVLILGDDNCVLGAIGSQINTSANGQERAVKQSEDFCKGEDCFQSNLGVEPNLVIQAGQSYYANLVMGFTRKYNVDVPEIIGIKSLFATPNSLTAAMNVFPNPYVIYLHRNLKDSYNSYIKCPWRGYPIDSFARMWATSMRLMLPEYSTINDRVGYEEISELDWLRKLADKLEIEPDYNKVQAILDNKIVDSVPSIEPEIYEQTIVENL